MTEYNKLLDLDRIDMESDFTKAVPQKIMASDSNPNGAHLYIEQRAYIAKELEEQGYGNIAQALKEFVEKMAEYSDNLTYNKSMCDSYEVGFDEVRFLLKCKAKELIKELYGTYN